MLKFLIRISLVMAALMWALPKVSGINFHGDLGGALATSLIFNVSLLSLEWLLGILVFSINISTLGLGFFITTAIRWVAGLLVPSLALFGTHKIMPQFLQMSNYFPDAIVGGLLLGGLLWVSLPGKSKR